MPYQAPYLLSTPAAAALRSSIVVGLVLSLQLGPQCSYKLYSQLLPMILSYGVRVPIPKMAKGLVVHCPVDF